MNRQSMTTEEAGVLNNLMPGNQITGLGDKIKYALDALKGGFGTAYFLDPANGLDTNDGLSPATAFKTIAVAYAALTANKNDVLYYIAGTGSINLSATFTWAKSYTHFIGLASPVGVGGRARIFQTATATGVSPLVNVTASGCIFANLYIFHGVADATSKVAVQVTGQRNYFEGCHFAGIGDATMDVAGAASLKIAGGSENVFKKCFIGLDTQGTRGANSTELWFTSTASRNRFEDCQIYAYISHASHALVTVEDATAIDRFVVFENCLFLTDSTNQLVSETSVFNIKAVIVQGKIILKNSFCLTDGTPDWDSNNRGIIWNNSVAAAASAAGGAMTKQ